MLPPCFKRHLTKIYFIHGRTRRIWKHPCVLFYLQHGRLPWTISNICWFHTRSYTHTFFATMKLTFLLLSGTSQQLLDKLLSCEFVNSGSVELLFLHPVVCFLAASDVQVHYSVEWSPLSFIETPNNVCYEKQLKMLLMSHIIRTQ